MARQSGLYPPALFTHVLEQSPKKFLKEWRRGRIKQAIVLLDTPPTGFCYAVLAQRADAVCLTYQPIPFLTPNGGTQTSGAGQAFLYFGPDPALFRKFFTGLGAGQCGQEGGATHDSVSQKGAPPQEVMIAGPWI